MFDAGLRLILRKSDSTTPVYDSWILDSLEQLSDTLLQTKIVLPVIQESFCVGWRPPQSYSLLYTM